MNVDPGSYSLEWARKVDQICDAFERALDNGESVSITQYLGDTKGHQRSSLFEELVRVEVAFRKDSGETPKRGEYAEQFPDLSDTVAIVEGVFDKHDSLLVDDARNFGRLRCIRKLGAGAFGTVWKAWDPILRRFVAIKEFSSAADQDLAETASMQNEARAVARLDHPGVVKLYNARLEGPSPYLELEYVDGGNLSELLRRETIDPVRAASICCQVAFALDHAHEHAVLHRDLKPANILINTDGNALITDFGLARRIDAATTIDRPGQIVGTLPYMSPEQASGDPSTSSDVYSLGAILYRMISGKRPFDGEPNRILNQILNDDPPAPRSVNAMIPRDLETICMVAMSKLPEHRYTTAGAMAQDLQDFLHGIPPSGRRVGRISRLMRLLRRRWSLTLAWTTPFVLLIVTCVVLFQNLSQDGKQSDSQYPHAAGDWTVHIASNPPGAKVLVLPVDSETGAVEQTRMAPVDDLTPATTSLSPGEYHVTFILKDEDSPSRSRSVSERFHVPQWNSPEVRSQSGDTGLFEVIGKNELQWPEQQIPPWGWYVHIETEPEGAEVVIVPLDSVTGYPLSEQAIWPAEKTPFSVQLASGEYQVSPMLRSESRWLDAAHRHVPRLDETTPFGSTRDRDFRIIGEYELAWSPLVIPPRMPELSDDTGPLVYFLGTSQSRFGVVNVPSGVLPFYVAPHEFTYGEFFDMQKRTGGGTVRNHPRHKPRILQPNTAPMTDTYANAYQWAEKCGCRLLSEPEFAYLEALAFQEGPVIRADDGSEVFAIRSSLAEWTNSQHNPRWAVDFDASPAFSETYKGTPTIQLTARDFRIIRGGGQQVIKGKIEIPPAERKMGVRSKCFFRASDETDTPGVGFRLARGAIPPWEKFAGPDSP